MLILYVFILCWWHRHAITQENKHIIKVVTTNAIPTDAPMKIIQSWRAQEESDVTEGHSVGRIGGQVGGAVW